MNNTFITKPILGFCAWSGTGKTTLLKQLIPVLTSSGLRIGIVKHAHHHFDIDHPGKDSYVLREAGASQILLSSRHRMAWIAEIEEEQSEPSLSDSLNKLDLDKLDLVLVEGFKHERYPKIELHRPALEKPLLFTDDEDIVALAIDEKIAKDITLPENLTQLDLNNIDEIARYVLQTTIVNSTS